MKSLVIHIGLPKTATTAAQKHLFPRFQGFIGRRYPTQPEDLGRRLHKIYLRPKAEWDNLLESWIRELGDIEHTVLVSDEHFSKWPLPDGTAVWPFAELTTKARRQGVRPISEFIEKLSSALPSGVSVRVIVVLRNQADFMISLFSQMIRRSTNPGPRAFESRVRKYLKGPDPFFDWNQLIEELTRVVGGNDLLCLLFENGLESNAREMVTFLGMDPETLEGEVFPRENTLQHEGGVWEVPMTRTPLTARGWAGRMRLRLRDLLASAPTPVFEFMKRGLSILDMLSRGLTKRIDNRAGGWGEAGSISLSAELREEIIAAYRQSNLSLKSKLSVDLERHGYI